MDFNEYKEQMNQLKNAKVSEERAFFNALNAKYLRLIAELSDKMVPNYNIKGIAVGDVIYDGEVAIQVEDITFMAAHIEDDSYLEFRGTPVSKKTFMPLKRTTGVPNFVQQRYGKFPEILKKNNA